MAINDQAPFQSSGFVLGGAPMNDVMYKHHASKNVAANTLNMYLLISSFI